MNDLIQDHEEQEDFSSFTPTPSTGDLLTLNQLVVRAGEIQVGLKKLEERTKTGENLLKDLLENQIPELMKQSGMAVGDFIQVGGFKVELKENDYAGIPALSTIEKERDPERREQLEERRERAFRLIEQKAPSLIKRSFEITFDREQTETSREFYDMVSDFRNVCVEAGEKMDVNEGKTVHPRTLAKWVAEYQKEGHNLTVDELDTLGVYTRKVAKITK